MTSSTFPNAQRARASRPSGSRGSTDLLLPFFDVTRNRENFTEISFCAALRRLRQGGVQQQADGRRDQRHVGALHARRHGTSTFSADSAGSSSRRTTRSPPAARPSRRNRRTSGTPPTGSTRPTTSTARSSAARARYDQGRWLSNGVLKVGLGRDGCRRSTSMARSSPTTSATSVPTQTFTRRILRTAHEHRRPLTNGVRGGARDQLNVGYRVDAVGDRSTSAIASCTYEQRRATGQPDQPQHQSDAKRQLRR